MESEPSNGSFLQTISQINFQKWHSKVRIVISKDFQFEVVALIDSGADLNCIQEGIIPSKYFRKTKERLTFASGGKMQIEFKIPKAHVCQDNAYFKTTFVLVKNMTDRVILGNPFMCLLYPFITDSEGITTHPFGQPVRFKFLRSPEPKGINCLQEVSISKTLNLINAKISSENLNQEKNLNHSVSSILLTNDDFLNLNQFHKPSSCLITCTQHKSICSLASHDFNKNVFKNNHFVNTWQEEKQITDYTCTTSEWKMASSSRNKGKAPIQGFPYQRHEGASSRTEPREATSLQEEVPFKIIFSSGNVAITLQEVLSRNFQFTNGVYTELPPSIRIILDNLQRALPKATIAFFKKPSEH